MSELGFDNLKPGLEYAALKLLESILDDIEREYDAITKGKILGANLTEKIDEVRQLIKEAKHPVLQDRENGKIDKNLLLIIEQKIKELQQVLHSLKNP